MLAVGIILGRSVVESEAGMKVVVADVDANVLLTAAGSISGWSAWTQRF